MSIKASVIAGVSLLCLTMSCGCSGGSSVPKPVPVSGTITLDGKPLQGARVTFDSDQRPAVGITSDDGSYKLALGALPGEYRVAIGDPPGNAGMTRPMAAPAVGEKPEPVPVELPLKYSDPQQTALRFTVPDHGSDVADFTLTTK
ncbi:MAG: hypothetical protein JWN70_246 [Planctomycetaceae bacterium]|nr:hypothetical protein [Planctomycetaceae bacterium]